MSEVYRGVTCAECGKLRGRPVACGSCGARSHIDPAQDACPSCLAAARPGVGARLLGGARTIGALCRRHPVLTFFVAVYLLNAYEMYLKHSIAFHLKAEPAHDARAQGDRIRAYIDGSAVSAPAPVAPYTEREAPLLASPRLLTPPGSTERDPRALLERAERLLHTGIPLTVVRTTLAAGAAELALAARPAPSQIAPVHFNGEVAGVRLQGFSPESLPSMAGLQNGDIVTSINGVPITTPERGLEAYQASRATGGAVMEVIRGAQRVVLAVSLPSLRTATRGAGGRAPGGSLGTAR